MKGKIKECEIAVDLLQAGDIKVRNAHGYIPILGEILDASEAKDFRKLRELSWPFMPTSYAIWVDFTYELEPLVKQGLGPIIVLLI